MGAMSYLRKLPSEVIGRYRSNKRKTEVNKEELSKLEVKCTKYHSRSFTESSMSFRAFLEDRHGVQMFMEFLVSEFSEENLQFWTACEDFVNNDDHGIDLQKAAYDIYKIFVQPGCVNEVNLDFYTREDIEHHLSYPTSTMFQAAQKRIQALMEKDSFNRFLERYVCQNQGCSCMNVTPTVTNKQFK